MSEVGGMTTTRRVRQKDPTKWTTVVCPCGESFPSPKSELGKYCCRGCSNKYKKRPAGPTTQEHRDKISQAKKGVSTGPHSSERLQNMSQATKKLWESDEYREKMSSRPYKLPDRNDPQVRENISRSLSEGMKKAWARGTKTESLPKSRSVGVHGGVEMRCLNSEGVFARQLDEAGIAWEYEPRRFKLSWCTYLPDFYLPELDIWVEIKGFFRSDGVERRKIDTFRQETGRTLVVVMQAELESASYVLGGDSN